MTLTSWLFLRAPFIKFYLKGAACQSGEGGFEPDVQVCWFPSGGGKSEEAVYAQFWAAFTVGMEKSWLGYSWGPPRGNVLLKLDMEGKSKKIPLEES